MIKMQFESDKTKRKL